MFSHCLHPSAQDLAPSASNSQLHLGATGHDRLIVDVQNDVDVAIENLVGDGAVDAAQHWADHGKLLRKFAIIRDYLSKGEHDLVHKPLGTDKSIMPVSGEPLSDPPERTLGNKGKGKKTNVARYFARESEEDTDFGHSDDERGRTAHKLFASLAGIDEEDKENVWWYSPPSSEAAEQDVAVSQDVLDAGSQGRGEPVGNGTWRPNRLTPVLFSLIPTPTNKPGLKLCNITPRQSQVDPSVRKKVAAKKMASPTTPRTPNPSRFIRPSTGATVGTGCSLASPICLLSSSPAVPAKGKGKRRTPERTRPIAGLSHVTRTVLSNLHPLNLTTKAFKSSAATTSMDSNVLICETTLDHKIEDIASSSAPPPTYASHTSRKVSTKRKQLTDEPSLAPESSKKRRHATTTIDSRPEIALHPPIAVSSSAILSNEAMSSNLGKRVLSKESFIKTEREKLALKRMDIAQQLANAYPHLVAPSYEKRRAKQLAKLMGKEQGRVGADAITTNQRLVQTQTIFSFETVDDDDGGMDWNRSKQLADNLRDAVANGRRPVLPLLKCAQSPSPSS
jgi:hypothetical protein